MITGGGFRAVRYSLQAAYSAGFVKTFKTLFSRNTCKTCAFGMGGQKGGMRDEAGNFPEVCKKGFQAQITDIQSPVPPNIFKLKSIEEFANTPGRLLERMGRLNTPLYKSAGATHYTPIAWDNALDKIASRFRNSSPEKSFFYSSGRSSNEAAFLLQIFARIYGSNNINNTSYYCHQASGVGISSALGTGTATVVLEDLDKVDLFYVIGCNPASNHPRFIRQLLNCRRRGGRVVVINPAKENGLVKFAVPSDFKSMLTGGSEIASEYIQLNIGGDIALLKGFAKSIIGKKKHNPEFMNNYTNGANEYIADIENTSWDEIVSASGIAREEIERIAEIYGNSRNTVFAWAVGITHHIFGSENVESIVNLALLRGMIGKPNAGLLPLRGHSNVQGIGSIGFTPALREKVLAKLEKHLSVELPNSAGMDTMSCMHAADKGEIEAAFLLGGNLYSSNPDTEFAVRALNKIPFKLYLTTTLNQGHFNGIDGEAVILPVITRDEEAQKTTQESMFNFVRLSDGGEQRIPNARSEVEIITEVAKRVLGNDVVDFDKFKSHEYLRKLISETVPGFEQMSKMDETNQEFQIEGRTYHEPKFSTPDGKANFRVCSIPALQGEEKELRMMSVRSEGQFNSIVYEEEDLYRGQKNRRVILMNKSDIRERNLRNNDLVTLESSTGIMEGVKVRVYDIKPGNVMMYYPESNVLISNDTDPRSKTPGYKLTWVKVYRRH